jgi:uncharacterized protein (DUF1778 family)
MSSARFDLKLEPEDKELLVSGAALMGSSIAGFVRMAVREKALSLLEREARLNVSSADFRAFTRALDGAFQPNVALRGALEEVSRRVRRS